MKVMLVVAMLAAFLWAVLLGTETHAMATIARTFCAISTAVFACAATVGLAVRSRI
jgi:hypothetical protein